MIKFFKTFSQILSPPAPIRYASESVSTNDNLKIKKDPFLIRRELKVRPFLIFVRKQMEAMKLTNLPERQSNCKSVAYFCDINNGEKKSKSEKNIENFFTVVLQ